MGSLCWWQRSAHSGVKTGWSIVLQVHVFTSAAANYLPKVRVLFDSLTEHHPEWRQHLLLVEDWSEAQCAALNLNAEVFLPRDLDIPNWRQWSFCHDLVELCTATKPFMLKRLLKREDCDAVLYFDPDIVLFSRLDDLLSPFAEASILLTPHQVDPESQIEAIISQEITSLRHGIYNLGFIGVKSDQEGDRFVDWWGARLYHFCRDDIANGLFTDQRWIDLVPAFFDRVRILRSTRFNVASWNMTTRAVSQDADGNVLVDGERLGFYHFTGLDSGNHDLQAVKFQNQTGVMELLLSDYLAAVACCENGLENSEWSFARFNDGSSITAPWRHWYRDTPEARLRSADPWSDPGYFQCLPEKTLARLDGNLSFYFDHRQELSLRALGRFLRAFVRSPTRARNLLAAGWRIWKSEGGKGLARRLRHLLQNPDRT